MGKKIRYDSGEKKCFLGVRVGVGGGGGEGKGKGRFPLLAKHRSRNAKGCEEREEEKEEV